MLMPRVDCPKCGRSIAAGPVAGRPGMGRLWRHDEPGMHTEYRGALVSCPGSLDVVDLPRAGRQLEFTLDGVEDQDDEELGPMLF